MYSDYKSTCPLCGRAKSEGKEFCDVCENFLCEYCGNRLSRGYCSLCGSLVCDEDSVMVGYARVCKKCLSSKKDLSDYNKFKNFVLSFRGMKLEDKVAKLDKILDIGNFQSFKDKIYLFVGIDDADSPYGMCTTYIGAKIVYEIEKFVDFMDYPLLVRLNPNIPIKTRGNASVGFRVIVNKKYLWRVIKTILSLVEAQAHTFFKKTNTAVAFYINDEYAIDKRLHEIYIMAVKDVLTRSIVEEMVSDIGFGKLMVYSSKYSRGIVGALSAVGAIFKDYTFELLAYRKPSRFGLKRDIDVDSVKEMDREFSEYTFNNIDGERLLIAPTGPDPVLFGIRGDFPDKLIEAFSKIRHEEIDLWCLYRSNQGTNEHILDVDDLSKARPYQTIRIIAKVSKLVKSNEKTTLILNMDSWEIEAVSYKPQKGFRKIISKLKNGDLIELVGNVVERINNKKIFLNVEEFTPRILAPEISYVNPLCPKCGKRLKKKDKNTMKCKACGYQISPPQKITIIKNRGDLLEGYRYLPPPSAQRHLTLPKKREKIRIKKIEGKIENRLIKPFISREKPKRWTYIKTIYDPVIK